MTKAIKKVDSATLRVTVELHKEDLRIAMEKAEASLSKGITVEGFRQGKAPLSVVRDHIDPNVLREEALQVAISESMRVLAEEEKLDILDQHDFSIQENSVDKLIYGVTLTLYPEIELGGYRGVLYTKKNPVITDEELDTVLKDIVTSRTKDGVVPEMNDDFAKSLGAFASLDDLKQQIRVGLLQEKEMKEQDRIHMELLRTVIASSKVTPPARMVEQQLDAMMANLDSELHAQGLELGPYLAGIKKTQEELRKEWQERAQEQVAMQLVLHAIAKTEHLQITAEELQNAVEGRLQQFVAGRPSADANALKDIDIEQVRNRMYSFLLNQKVFLFLVTNAKVS